MFDYHLYLKYKFEHRLHRLDSAEIIQNEQHPVTEVRVVCFFLVCCVNHEYDGFRIRYREENTMWYL